MRPGHRQELLNNEDVERTSRNRLLVLWVVTIASGLAGLSFILQGREAPWPKPFAFAWTVLFGIGLAGELAQRRKARRAAEAGRLRRGRGCFPA